MTITLKIGKYYRRRDGKVVGPIKSRHAEEYPFLCDGESYQPNGKWWGNGAYNIDLIAEVPKPGKVRKAKTLVQWMFTIKASYHDVVTSRRRDTKRDAKISRERYQEEGAACGPITRVELEGPGK